MKRRWLWVGLVLGLVVGIGAGAVRTGGAESSATLPPEFEEPLAGLLQEIRNDYVGPVDYDQLLKGAVQGVLSKLDDYTVYMPKEILEEFETDTEGEFGGLGIEIRFDALRKVVVVEQTIPGTPAFEKGVLAGDLIVRVREGDAAEAVETAKFDDVYDAVRVLRGAAGSQVTVTVLRGEEAEPQDITITRAVIRIPGVRAVEMVNKEHGIGYAYVAYFHAKTAEDLVAAIDELRARGAKGVVLDLRFNPGGLLGSAIKVANIFLDNKTIVRVQGRNGPAEVIQSSRGELYPGMPVVLLVNRYSASASEIVAAALSDNGRARLVGEPTHGKASVQQIFRLLPLSRGDGYKMTIAQYYTPAGQLIAGTGVKPDAEVPLDDEGHMRLARALNGKVAFPPRPEQPAPEGTPAAEAPAPAAEEAPTAAPEEAPVPAATEGQTPAAEEAPQEPFRDVQLERAIEVMTEMLAERQGTGQPVPAEPSPASVGS